MYARLKRLYKAGKLDEVGLQNAVALGWITREQYEEIISE